MVNPLQDGSQSCCISHLTKLLSEWRVKCAEEKPFLWKYSSKWKTAMEKGSFNQYSARALFYSIYLYKNTSLHPQNHPLQRQEYLKIG